MKFSSERNRLLAGVLGSLALLALPAAAVVPWTININTNNVVTVTNSPYNAVGDGMTTNPAAIQAAINSAATTNGGCTVRIPPGIFLSGPLAMKSAINLQLDAGAILRMLPLGSYPGSASFIGATNLTDVEISGQGAIDGQGAPWWTYFSTNSSLARPILVRIQGCTRQLIQNVTLSNSPMFHISISSNKGSVTVQGVTIFAPASSPNTDACDVSGTNVLVQNCNISEGDDDFTCSGGTHDVLLTNNTYGTGHGISIGSYTSGGVSNITVINCTMNGTANGIRIKSDNDRGGLVQNISYSNIGMTNVNFPIQAIAYYNWISTPSSVAPFTAASTNAAAVTSLTPIYRNITFSNINATAANKFPIGILWARTEMRMTNIVFNKVNITGDRSFDLYNVSGAQFIDCNLKTSATSNTFSLFNAQAIITNSAPTSTLFTFDGLTTNGYGNALAFYNAQGSLKNTNALDDGPLTLAASTFTVSNNLTLFPTSVVNFTLGTNPTKLAVAGNLALGGTNNIYAGAGFTNGIYNLATMTGTLSGNLPTLGAVPPNYNYSLYLGGSIPYLFLDVTLLPPTNLVATATNLLINLRWNAVNGATNYSLKRGTTSGGPYPTTFTGLTATNYADATVTNAVNFFYVVSAVGAGGGSSNSLPVSATPLPSNRPTNLVMNAVSNQMQLSWPQDHLGWRLQIQTNDLTGGLSPNWATVPNSSNVMQTNLVINPTNGSVFLRLVYP
jgi:polygalacturonase